VIVGLSRLKRAAGAGWSLEFTKKGKNCIQVARTKYWTLLFSKGGVIDAIVS
jgi:hypothetical protein